MGWFARTVIELVIALVGFWIIGLFGIYPSIAESFAVALIASIVIGVDEGLK